MNVFHLYQLDQFLKSGVANDVLLKDNGEQVAEWLSNNIMVTRLYRLPKRDPLHSEYGVEITIKHFANRDFSAFMLETEEENLTLPEAELILNTREL